jgi:hypothetical protein
VVKRWRLTDILYVVLLLATAIGAIGLSRTAKLNLAATVAALLPSVAPLFLAWRAFREDRSDLEQAVSKEDLLEQLALAVRRQWESEIRLRGVEDPYPLPISWRPAPPGLCDVSAGLPPTRDVRDSLRALLKTTASRRLVVLGDPGSGKTILLEIEHPDLRMPAPPSLGRGVTRSQALLDRGLVFPVLDGLDELPPAVRNRALLAINAGLGNDCGLVLSSRVGEFGEAVRAPGARSVKVRGATAIELVALESGDVSRFLTTDAGDAHIARRWTPVLNEMLRHGPVRTAFTTPLIVTLARAVYNPRPGQGLHGTPDPAELCGPR